MGEIFCGGRKCTTTSCEMKIRPGFYTREEKGRALGPCVWMPIITQATTLMPRHLETRKLGGGEEGGPKGPATPPSSLLLYRIVVGFRFSGFLIANSHQSKLHTNSNDI
jgi:hypothetical protein